MSPAFPDSFFDVTVAMFVMTVVPDPAKVMRELARVTGRVLICNHFSVDDGLRGALERGLSRDAARLGWRPEFPIGALAAGPDFVLERRTPVKPFGFFILLEFRKKN